MSGKLAGSELRRRGKGGGSTCKHGLGTIKLGLVPAQSEMIGGAMAQQRRSSAPRYDDNVVRRWHGGLQEDGTVGHGDGVVVISQVESDDKGGDMVLSTIGCQQTELSLL